MSNLATAVLERMRRSGIRRAAPGRNASLGRGNHIVSNALFIVSPCRLGFVRSTHTVLRSVRMAERVDWHEGACRDRWRR